MSTKNESSKWDKLSTKQRASLIREYVKNGVRDLGQIKEHYNTFPEVKQDATYMTPELKRVRKAAQAKTITLNEVHKLVKDNPPLYKKIMQTLPKEYQAKVIENAARGRYGYEGLNQAMTAAVGGLPGILSYTGSEFVNKGVQKLTNSDSWGDLIYRGENPVFKTLAEFTNPGSLLGISAKVPEITITKPMKVYHGSPDPLPGGKPVSPNSPGYKSGVGRVQRTEGAVYVTPSKSYAERYMSPDIRRGLPPTETSRLYQYHIDPSKLFQGKGAFPEFHNTRFIGSNLKNSQIYSMQTQGYSGLSFLPLRDKPEIAIFNPKDLHSTNKLFFSNIFELGIPLDITKGTLLGNMEINKK